VIDYSSTLARFEKPFLHFVGDQVLAMKDVRRLNRHAPPAERFERLARLNSHARRRYQFSVLNLIEDSQPCVDERSLSQPWRQLLTGLISMEFREWLHRATAVDVSGCRCSAGLFVHEDGDFQGVSTGKLDKALGVSLYLNEDWPTYGGGSFELHAADGANRKALAEVSPVGGRCLAFTPSRDSWHATAPVRPGFGLRRVFVTVQFF
jgi:SM-20-related protein